MNIFQTHKNMNYILNNRQLSKSVYSWAKFNNHSFNYYFYNDDISDEYIENMNKIGLLNNKYKIGRIIKIYTNIKNNAESCINIKKMRRKKSLFYYSCSVMSFIVSLIILFFSDFFINE